MVSQFISPHNVRLLGDLGYPFPGGTHALGRLDAPSEGLLLLTTNKKITRLLFLAEEPHRRTYLVMVKKVISDAAIDQLRSGIKIRIKGGGIYTCPPCDVERVEDPGIFNGWFIPNERIPYSWISISLTEGKFRQVRKMTEAAGHRCVRLIRIRIGDIELGNLQPGEVREISEDEFFLKLKLPL